MSLKSKTYYVSDDSYCISGENMIWNFHRGNHLQVGWNFREDNYDYYEGGSFGKGNATINPDQIHVLPDPSPGATGDLIVSVGWGDGFCVRKMETAGSMSVLFHDTTAPVNASCNSIGIDKVRYEAYTGGYTQDGFAKYNFADTSSISQVDTITIASNGISHQRPGTSYINGLGVAGDWLYVGHYDIGDYNYITKWNTQTSQSDDLLVLNRITDFRYGQVRYEEDLDRMHFHWLRDGDWCIVVSASLSSSAIVNGTTSQSICMRTSDLGISNDHYSNGHVRMSGSLYEYIVAGFIGRFTYCDVGNMLTASSITPGDNAKLVRENSAQLNRAEVRYFPQEKVSWYGSLVEANEVLGSKLILCTADRNHLTYMGWIDQVNMVLVGDPYYFSYGFGTGDIRTGGGGTVYTWESDGNEFFAGYGGQCVLATGEDGDDYWIFSMYNSDGFRSYAKSTWPDGFGLCETAQIIFGSFELPNNLEIGSIYIGNVLVDLYTASGATMDIKVTNDGGTSWESYDYVSDDTHYFDSVGTSSQIKLEFSGSISQSAYFNGGSYLSVTLMEKDPVKRNDVIGYSTFNIVGA